MRCGERTLRLYVPRAFLQMLPANFFLKRSLGRISASRSAFDTEDVQFCHMIARGIWHSLMNIITIYVRGYVLQRNVFPISYSTWFYRHGGTIDIVVWACQDLHFHMQIAHLRQTNLGGIEYRDWQRTISKWILKL